MTATGPVRTFLTWWGTELADLATSKPRRLPPHTLVSLDGDKARILPSPSAPQVRQIAGLLAPAPLTEVLVAIASSKLPRAIVIRLADGACFSRLVSLPRAASRDFARLVAIDLERVTPFKPAEVYAGFAALPAAEGPQQLVRHVVVKRPTVESLRAAVAANGLELAGIEYAPADGTAPIVIDTSPATSIAAPQRTPGVRMLAALCAILGVTAAMLLVQRQETALAALQKETAAPRAGAQAARERVARSQGVEATLRAFNAMRAAETSRAAILEELTRILPDTAWLTELKIHRGSVDISGLAASASALIPALEQSPYFVDARTASPVSFDQQTGKERFGLHMRLRNAEAPVLAETPDAPIADDPAAGDAAPLAPGEDDSAIAPQSEER